MDWKAFTLSDKLMTKVNSAYIPLILKTMSFQYIEMWYLFTAAISSTKTLANKFVELYDCITGLEIFAFIPGSRRADNISQLRN